MSITIFHSSGSKKFYTKDFSNDYIFRGNLNISGSGNFSNSLYINNNPVLTGQFHTIQCSNLSGNPLTGENYFGNFSLGFSVNPDNRKFIVSEGGTIKKYAWTYYAANGVNSLYASGIIKNVSKSTTTTFTGLLAPAGSSSATFYTGTVSIPVSAGDQIVVGLNYPNATPLPSGVANGVILYVYS